MSESETLLKEWADEVRNGIHALDIRLTKLETTNKVLRGVVAFLLTVIAIIVAVIALG